MSLTQRTNLAKHGRERCTNDVSVERIHGLPIEGRSGGEFPGHSFFAILTSQAKLRPPLPVHIGSVPFYLLRTGVL